MIPYRAVLANFRRKWNQDDDNRQNPQYQLPFDGRRRLDLQQEIPESIEDSNPEASFSSRFWQRTRRKVELKGGIWRELNGALGGLGTFLPAALALSHGSDFGTTLVFTGIFNVVTGLFFGIPIPVQPMSFIVIAARGPNPLTVAQVMAAGMITGLVLGLLGITGLMDFMYRFIPFPVVRGVMLCAGSLTIARGVKNILLKQDLATMLSLGIRSWLGVDGLLLPVLMLLFVGVVTGIRNILEEEIKIRDLVGRDGMSETESLLNRVDAPTLSNYRDNEAEECKWTRLIMNFPTALLILLTALVLAVVRNPSSLKNLEWGPSPLKVVKISWEDWKVGLLEAAVYEIPASIFTSVLSLCKLSSDYFPRQGATPGAVCLSVCVMNWLGCWFGVVPVDHGAVGLAGQHKFGARSGLSMVMLGTLKVVVGLLLGSSLSGVLFQFPQSLLGVLLLWSGIEMIWVCRDSGSCEDSFVMVAVLGGSLVTYSSAYNTTLGFIGAIGLYVFLKR